MKKFNLTQFIFDLQQYTPEDAIAEIMTSGLTDKEIIFCLNQITFNSTFRFKKSY